MKPIDTLCSRCVFLPTENIATDQIIPARFLKVTARSGLGRFLFADWRLDASGEPRTEFPLNDAASRGARVLVAGHNFGCGSAREHAPWALFDYGFRAVVSTGIAGVFRGNAVRNGIVPVEVSAPFYARLMCDRDAFVTIDLATQTIAIAEGRAEPFPLDPFARHCLMNGVDELAFLLSHEGDIAAYEGGLRVYSSAQ